MQEEMPAKAKRLSQNQKLFDPNLLDLAIIDHFIKAIVLHHADIVIISSMVNINAISIPVLKVMIYQCVDSHILFIRAI